MSEKTPCELQLEAQIAAYQNEARALFEAREAIKAKIDATRRLLRAKWDRKASMETGHLIEVLAKRYDVDLDNPKFKQIFAIAWSRGHSAGLNEVSNCFDEMADLLR